MLDKFAIVTGASTGIGRAVALALASVGYKVALVGRNEKKLLETEKLILDEGGKTKIFVCDLTNTEEVIRLISEIKTESKKIDVLFNAAGIWHGENEVYAGTNLEDFKENVILDTYAVGLTAPTLLIHGLIPLMKNGSSVINLSGTFENGGGGWLPYYTSKRALEDLTLGLADELKDKGIKVNCVSPSDTATEEYKRFFPEDALDAQTPETVAQFFIELINKDVTGKIYLIKKGEVSEGYHK